MPNVFVFTIDQVASRSGTDQVPALLAKLKDLPTVIPFARTVGDEVQGVLDDTAAAVEVLLKVLYENYWHNGFVIIPLLVVVINNQLTVARTFYRIYSD